MNQWRISDCRLWNWSLVHWMKDTRTHLIIIISWNYLKWTEALSNSGYHDLFLYLSYLLAQHDVSCLSLFINEVDHLQCLKLFRHRPPPKPLLDAFLHIIQTELSAAQVPSTLSPPGPTECSLCHNAPFRCSVRFWIGSGQHLAPRNVLLSPTINIIISVECRGE